MRRKRIALSVPVEMDAVLDRLAILTNQPKTKLIMEMLNEYVPILEQTVSALEQIEQSKDKASNIAKQFANEILLEGNEKLGQIALDIKKIK